ncbi:hypothetical protein DYB26_001223 [Aphanomyces astaci]|uniref:Magnesium transporter n=3 Tax=Aphanomyces astaci TaxID=112090 RepID=A0A397AG97_APHAT|nr:hypothetical protein DYB36_000433 [Aphanomyces astaci]RHZ13172.1 hypothetical protein DYB26_001223 [Aphanomyces astaci]RHZ28281.1 hypothetical protein DYB31_000297 [Aphanomyces astaci]
MFVPTGADTLIQILRDKVAQCCAEDDDIAFEFRYYRLALEAIFYTLCKYRSHRGIQYLDGSLCRLLSGDCEKLVDKVSLALTRLSSASFASGELETLTILKNKVHEFESQVGSIYTTAWSHDIHAMRTKVGLLQTRMVNTENIVMLKLDSVRNALLSIDTIFGMVMLAMNLAMFVSSAFGMNLVSGYETQPHLFWAVLGVSTTAAGVLIYVGIRYFKAKGVILL